MTERETRALQRNLRQLGYLRDGIDGGFGPVTRRAVMAIQHDLLHNSGGSSGGDGPAPVRITDYNRGRVTAVDGVAGAGLLDCIADMAADENYPKLPRAEDPEAENNRMISAIAALQAADVPVPFLLAILQQESGLKHYNEPSAGDEDTFVVVGLDTNAGQPYAITSRGYGAGQYTIFHHPPRPEEIRDFVLDPVGNVRKAMAELKQKFENFVNGKTPGTRAEDRIAEFGRGPLRVCKHPPGSPLRMRDCRRCAESAGAIDIKAAETPLFPGCSSCYAPTQYYAKADYANVPVRANISCDWPYAVRRYNGAGMNSYHYQAKVLRNLIALEA